MTLLGLAAKNVLRNKARTVLTILGVAIAVLTFVVLRTVITSWQISVNYAAKDRIGTRHKVSFVIPMPRRYMETIRGIRGVEASTWFNWFGGKDPKRPDAFSPTLAVDPESLFTVMDEIQLDDEAKGRWREDRQGAIVGRNLAKKLGLEVGETYTLSGTIFPGDWPFHIVGIYSSSRKSFDESQFLFRWDYMNERVPARARDQVGWVISRISNARDSAQISRRIDRELETREAPTLTMSERALNLSFLAMLSAVLTAINIVSVIILLILLLILGNTVAMGVRERTNEYGVLRAIGFGPSHVRLFILGEAVTLGLIAGLVGIGLAVPLVNGGMSRFIEEEFGSIFPYFRIETITVVAALVIAALLAAVSGLWPAIRASRLAIVEALRRVD